jgi:hypothetical protein
MSVRAALVHRLPGRIRLRMQEKRGDTDYFSRLSADFSALDDVHHVRTNASTGSVVIEFSGTQEALIERLREHDVAVVDMNVGEETGTAATLPKAVDLPPLMLVSGRSINALFLVGTVLTAATLVQTLRGKLLGPALPMFWSALEAFRRAGQRRK